MTTERNPDRQFEQNTPDIKPQQKKIAVLEEKVEVTKKVVEKARIRVSKKVVETPEFYDVPLTSEEIIVKRVPKNEVVETAPPGVRYEGSVMIIPVLKEVAVIEKKLMLVEEIHVTKQKNEKMHTHKVVVRSEDVLVERTEIITPTP